MIVLILWGVDLFLINKKKVYFQVIIS